MEAHDAYSFVVNWLEKFPQFKSHDLYLAGESYAGHYVPQLAEKIVHMNKKAAHKINLKGILIGNPAIDSSSDDRGLADYAWDHAVISDEVYGAIKSNCKFSDDADESDACNSAWNDFFNAMNDIDLYSLYTPACTNAMINSTSTSTRHHRRGFMPALGKRARLSVPYYNAYDPCGDYHVIAYLNRPDVQTALHANVSGAIPYRWEPCSDALTNWTDAPASTLPAIGGLVKAGLRVWVFSGDTDDRVPVTSTRLALRKISGGASTKYMGGPN
jgi:serine carboxypeptidase-like clade 2